MSRGIFLVPLTTSQRMALVDILLEHLMEPGTSKEFVDCSVPGGKTTRHADLLLLLDRAAWFSEGAAVDLARKLINYSLEKAKATTET